MEYLDMLIGTIALLFVLFIYFFHSKDGLPTNWPVVGMLPALRTNSHRLHDFLTEVMDKSQGMTFLMKGPWFSNLNFLITADSANINYVFSRNFENYGKGSNYNEIFDVLGDGIFNADGALWDYHRKLTHSFLAQPNFQPMLINTIHDEIRNNLFPVFDHLSKNDIEIDLQDLFFRFTLDNICTVIMNYKPRFLSIDFPPMPVPKAVADLSNVIIKRYLLPTFVWKSLRWLGFGEEKYKSDCAVVDDFIYMLIAKNKEEHNELSHDLMTCMNKEDNAPSLVNRKGDDKFLRDTIVNLIAAGLGTTSIAFSWFFYLLSKYPQECTKIREELNTVITQNYETIDGFLKNFDEYNKKLVYLHAAICETLRLYPPLAFNQKAPLKSDILPSGHQLNPKMFIIFNMYAMGRMKSLWGEDCAEFKPKRWITNQGKIKPEPSYKFFTFGTGPRTCQGKDMAFTQLKLVIAATIIKYDIEVVNAQEIVYESSTNLLMKHGLKVKIKCC